MNCPNCAATTDSRALDGVYGAPISVDLCFLCKVLWLDKTESVLLSPHGTLDLFRVLLEHNEGPRQSLSQRLGCPRCQRRLSLSQDIGKAGRFSYYSCPAGHGRLTPFSEFLKEKQFVRALSPGEQQRFAADVKSVQCSSCGAPVDLTKGFECQHCGAPITVLDHDAVEKTIRELEDADAHRAAEPDQKEMRARALAAMEAVRTDPTAHWQGITMHHVSHGIAGDLLTTSIKVLFGNLGGF
jgi:DNA-directed RNA polymerase subunit RPC12/RpoP